jgi:hypothetical protein
MSGPMNAKNLGSVVKEAMVGKKKKDDNLPKKPGGRFANSRMNGPMKSSATPNFGKK